MWTITLICGSLLGIMAFRQLTAGRLNERNALAWLVGAAACLCLWLFPWLIAPLATLLGLREVSLLLGLLSTVFLLCLLLYYAAELSRLQLYSRELAQQLAILSEQESAATLRSPPADGCRRQPREQR